MNAHIALDFRGNPLPIQRTSAGLAYDQWRAGVDHLRNSRDPRERAVYKAAASQMMADFGIQVDGEGRVLNVVSPTTVHTNKFLTDLSVKYTNDAYIGARLMPIVQRSKRSDSFVTYDERDHLGAPDDEIGPNGEVNEVEESRGTDNYSVKDYGLRGKVLQETLDNQDEIFDELTDATEHTVDGVELRQEIRISSIVMNVANYAAGQTHVATGKWNAASSSIVSDLLTAVSEIWHGAGRNRLVAACGIAVWNAIANNAEIKGLFNNVREGLATTDAVARYFGIDELLIGRSRQDTANIGQPSGAFSRIWSVDNFAILSVAERPTRRSAHWGSTFQHGARKFNSWTDPAPGPGAGAHIIKVGQSQDHKVVANRAGYIITDVLA